MSTHAANILLVDDHPDALQSLALALNTGGYRCVGVASAAAAWEQVTNERFDVLLTDVMLRDTDGWQLIEELSRRGTLPPQIIVMSATPSYLTPRRGLDQLVCGYLTKPFRLPELEQALLGCDGGWTSREPLS